MCNRKYKQKQKKTASQCMLSKIAMRYRAIMYQLKITRIVEGVGVKVMSVTIYIHVHMNGMVGIKYPARLIFSQVYNLMD